METAIFAAEDKEEYDSTGGSTYLKSCEALGIIPASYFVRGIQSKQTAIHMTHHGVGHKGAKAIAVALTVSCYLLQVYVLHTVTFHIL